MSRSFVSAKAAKFTESVIREMTRLAAKHDAINLAAKLGRVCRGEAGEELLDLYVRQRRTVNLEYVQDHSVRNLKRLSAKSDDERKRNFDDLRRAASTREGAREFLLISSMIASVRRADAIT